MRHDRGKVLEITSFCRDPRSVPRFKDRGERDMVLAMTHEEVVTDRVREFTMKDSYSLDADEEGFIVVHESVRDTSNLVAGANKPGFHLRNVNLGRDSQADVIADIAAAAAGRPCAAIRSTTDDETERMNEHDIHRYITEAFAGVETVTAEAYTFYFYGAERQLPFVTLANADTEFDRVSDLDRPGVFRLNIGVSRDTYVSYLGPESPRLGPQGRIESGHDFTVLDRILPHPFYAPQSWIWF